MLGIDTFIKNCFASIALLVFEKHFFTFCHPKLHCNYHDQQLHGRNILRYALCLILCFKVFLCLIPSGLRMLVRRKVISMYLNLLALTEHWLMLYVKILSLRSSRLRL